MRKFEITTFPLFLKKLRMLVCWFSSEFLRFQKLFIEKKKKKRKKALRKENEEESQKYLHWILIFGREQSICDCCEFLIRETGSHETIIATKVSIFLRTCCIYRLKNKQYKRNEWTLPSNNKTSIGFLFLSFSLWNYQRVGSNRNESYRKKRVIG